MTASNDSPASIAARVASTVRAAPWHFIVLQIPEMSVDIVDKLLEADVDKTPWHLVVTVVPYFIVASTLSTSLTFVSVTEHLAGRRPTLAGSFQAVVAKAKPLFAAAFLAALLVLVGLPLFLLPALYFLTLYLFVPYYVMAEPAAPPSVYLALSKRLAKAHFWRTLAVVVMLLVVGLVLYGVGESVDGWTKGNRALDTAGWGIKIFISLVASCMINVGVSHFFLKLRTA